MARNVIDERTGLIEVLELAASNSSSTFDQIEPERLVSLLATPELPEDLFAAAREKRDRATGSTLSYSPKVFIDLTRLCRDRCSYCTFIRTPASARDSARDVVSTDAPYLLPEEVLEIATTGERAGCKEALFTLGDRPEERYSSARRFLSSRGHSTTAEYLVECAQLVLDETNLLPHLNPGVMTESEIEEYRKVSVSAGLMLESTSRELYEEVGGCHYGSPDKDPAVRLDCIDNAGRRRVPFTTGMLVGIGETLLDRVNTLLAMARSAIKYGHIQEVIVQPFRAKPTIPMRNHSEPTLDELLRVIALARLLLPERVAVQAPPNLTAEHEALINAGISDWGGISPVTPDHVNPEAPWPHVAILEEKCSRLGFTLRPRLPIYPRFVREENWLDSRLEQRVRSKCNSYGWPSDAERLPLHHP